MRSPSPYPLYLIRHFTLALLLLNCAAPKSVIHSGKVTSKKHLKINIGASVNVPTATGEAVTAGVETLLENLIDNSTDAQGQPVSQQIGPQFKEQQEALAMWGVDPIAVSFLAGARFGVYDNIDVGIAKNGGANALDLRYQFLGSKGDHKNPGEETFYGSTGLQYSSLDYEMPSLLGKVQSLFKYEFKRKDFLVPVVFSNSFGKEEKFGAISYGLAYNLTLYEYAFDKSITNLFYYAFQGDLPLDQIPESSGSIHAFGPLVNIKLGYKYVYLRMGLTIYYQNYGTFELVGTQSKEFSGITTIPDFGIDISI